MRGRKIVKNYFEPEVPHRQLCRDVKVERSGFIPRSVMIAKMQATGELNKLIIDYENDKLMNRKIDDTNTPVSILNIKDLSRTQMIKLARERYSDFREQLSAYEKSQINLLNKLQGTRVLDDTSDVNADTSSDNEKS